ncbi:hypothetical protein LXL04_014609 [Taraxacum kok-saghyz]
MHSWKDAFKEKITNFFYEPSSSDSSTSSDPDQTSPPLKDESYLSSILSFLFPSEESISKEENDYEPGSLKIINCKDPDAKDENPDLGSGKSTSSNEVFEDAIDLKTPRKHVQDLNLDSVFISSDLSQFFQSCLPNIVKGCRWGLIYSTLKHGISLRTLIRNTFDLSGPCLLITGDTKGAIFGGMLNCPLTPTPQRKYQGTFQTFVFTTVYGPPTLFRPTGANRYFYICSNDLLAFGGGGSFALRLDADLLTGTSGPCDTFGNRCLAHNEEFELKNVELWGFNHSSRSEKKSPKLRRGFPEIDVKTLMKFLNQLGSSPKVSKRFSGKENNRVGSQKSEFSPKTMGSGTPKSQKSRKLIESNTILESFEKTSPPGGENAMVIYTTTLRGIRKTFEDCNTVGGIIESHHVRMIERDISMDSGCKEELRLLLGKKTS